MPLDEIPIDLQRKQIQKEMSNVTMKQTTHKDSPDLMIYVQSWKIFVLQTIERTVPGYVCLLL